MKKTRSSSATATLQNVFSGKKEKWLPLYRRLIARSKELAASEIRILKSSIHFGQAGVLRVKREGIELGLSLGQAAPLKSPRLEPRSQTPKRLTHRLLITETAEIDDDLLLFIKAAMHQARSARRRST